jgi:cell shape-determining protein MreC
MEYVLLSFLAIIIAYGIASSINSMIDGKKKEVKGNRERWKEYNDAQKEIEELEERLKELKGE